MSALTITLKIPSPAIASLAPKIRRAICAAIDRENQNTISHAIRHYLSRPGPATLATRTGRLGNSLRATPAQIAPDGTITARITTTAPYAAAHEYGITAQVGVRAHIRSPLASFKPYARAIHVRAHTRHMNLPQRSYLRTSIQDRAADYKNAITAALQKT